MHPPINTSPIQQFVQQVKSAEIDNQKEIRIDIKKAKALAFCLTEVTARLLQDYDKVLAEMRSSTNSELTISMDGGSL